jgi:hypothetical protein
MTHHTNIYLLLMWTLFCVVTTIGLNLWIEVLEVLL